MKTAFAMACAVGAIVALSPACAHTHASSKKSRHPVPPALTVEQVNDAKLTGRVAPGSHGAATLRAQILLDRAHFSSGEIDAGFGSNLRFAILGYQSANGLAATGVVDAPTWAALDRDDAPALVEYVLTATDVAGPFAAIPADIAEQSKLAALGYASPAEELGERFHASPSLLQRLNPGKDFSQAGIAIMVPNVATVAPLAKGARVVVDKSDSTASLLDAAGKVLAQFPASTGSAHDPLPLGTWKIQSIATNPVYHYNPALFWDADQANAKTKVAAGPNNPVGVVWIDLSKPHYGIHGTPEPSRIGKTESHGCIRLTNWDALTLSQAVTAGVPVILQE